MERTVCQIWLPYARSAIHQNKPGGKLYNWKPKLPSFKGATYMTAIRWKLYNEVKALFPDINVHVTYGAETKERRRTFDIAKSHVNDAFVMGQFHPKHRSKPVCYKKKRRNNRCLEKFYRRAGEPRPRLVHASVARGIMMQNT